MSTRDASIGRSLGGVLPVLCMPFLDDGRLDDASLRRLVDHELAAGVDGIVVHGLAGEAYKLSDAERQRALSVVVEAVGGSVPVIAGCDHPGIEPAVARAREAAGAGAAAVMALPPTFMKASRAELVDYYVRLGEAAGRPVIVQDAPAWTGVDFSVDLLAEIAAASNVPLSVKVESPPTAPRIRRLREAGLDALGGYGAVHLAEELEAGISAFMPGCALPELYVDIWRAHRGEDADRVYELFARALPLLAFQMSSLDIFIGAQKALLHDAGVISCAAVRSPGAQLDDQQVRWLRLLLERTDLAPTSPSPPTR